MKWYSPSARWPDLSRLLVLKRASTFHTRKNTAWGRGRSDPTAPCTHQSVGISLQVIWIGCADGRGLIVLTEPLETIAVEVGDTLPWLVSCDA